MRTRVLQFSPMLLFATLLLFFASCSDDEKPKTIPEVTTAPIVDITPTSAYGGGEIISDGNSTITASGLCYSSTNATPTISDSKTELSITTGTFTSLLENLTSGTAYHVRAYATNSVGTGYGEVVTFTTGNAAPVATNVLITGTAQVGETLTANYTYSDAENDLESGSLIQWYIANDGAGAGETAIAGATTSTYTLLGPNEFKFVRVGITPKAATGNTSGSEVKSPFVGPVAAEPTTVTFTYNGATVTYGIVTSSVTGRKWLDRNLGAPNLATSHTDFANYGDLFQFGRPADGHQVITRGATNATTSGVATTTTLSSTDSPGHSQFIIPSGPPVDWRNPQNNNLWQGVNGINNPCPAGWRIPTTPEWQAENLTTIQNGYTQLKLTFTGIRNSIGSFTGVAAYGSFWSISANATFPTSSDRFDFRTTTQANPAIGDHAEASACRCIKN